VKREPRPKAMHAVEIYTVSQKNVPPSTCYNIDIHDPITIIFGRNVTGKVKNHMMLCYLPSSSAVPCEIENREDSALVHCACDSVQLLQRYQLQKDWRNQAAG